MSRPGQLLVLLVALVALSNAFKMSGVRTRASKQLSMTLDEYREELASTANALAGKGE